MSIASGRSNPDDDEEASAQGDGEQQQQLLEVEGGGDKALSVRSARSGASQNLGSQRSSGRRFKEEQEEQQLTAAGDGLLDERQAPFKMPADNDIFVLRDAERRRKKAERERQKGLKVHEKVPKKSSISFRQAALLEQAGGGSAASDSALAIGEDSTHTMAVTRDRQIESETLSDYISKKREMFLLSYSLGVKRDEMRKLEEVAAAEEKKLELAEQYLEEDASMFDEFLKENNKNSADAIKIADEEAKLKLQKVNEIKRLNAQLTQMKSEITKFEEQLREYIAYKEFLERLMPEEERQRRQLRREAKAKEKSAKSTEPEREKTDVSRASRSNRVTIREGTNAGSQSNKERTSTSLKTIDDDDNSRAALEKFLAEVESEDEEDMELYFTEPQQLLQIFTELEEANLNLIQNCQESEETLEEMRQANQILSRRMDREAQTLNEQIDKLNKSIEREEAKAKELEIKSKLFSFGQFDAEKQEEMLHSLNSKVEEVYRACFGDNEASISTLQMLTDIENRIESLIQTLETLPADRVEAAQKAKEKERRLKAREEKKEQERVNQEKRVKRALERAREPPKKHEGRPIMARSQPPAVRKRDDGEAERLNREEEEMQYFFT